jgi:hypothetical protein
MTCIPWRGALCGLAALVVAAGLLAWDRFGFHPPRAEMQIDERDSPWHARLRFSVTNPNAYVDIGNTRYECIFEFPDVPRLPGKITAITSAVDKGGPISATGTRTFDCTPFIPRNLKSRILVHLLFAYRGRSLLFDHEGVLATSYFQWIDTAGRRGWHQ